jgi:hypothetical protein
MSRAFRSIIASLVASVALAVTASPARAATLFDPAYRFRTLRTAHFVIHFHQGEDRLAQRLATIAENTWHTLERPLGVQPPRLTQVVLVDQTELANGYATPLPRDTVVMYTVAPAGYEFDFDNWLEIAFTHEFTHIIHLDRSEGWARPVRAIFGRSLIAFPNLFLPLWQIEGLATYEESIVTGEGRLHEGDFRAIVNEAARQHALEPLDRVNGGLTDWPGGSTIYAYGVGFHQYLADRFGADRLATLADATAGSLPYFSSLAFRSVYGESLGALWRDYETSVTDSHPPVEMPATVRRLTHQGFAMTAPRIDRFACAGCPVDVFYAASNADDFPSLYRVGLDSRGPERVVDHYLTSAIAIGHDELFFSELEFRNNVGLYSDLYAWSRAGGRIRRLSHDARLADPDLAPDGTTLACVRNEPGHRDLVVVPATGDVRALVSDPDTQFDSPRWSPDGRSIVVERHRLGAMPEIVVVDAATAAVRVIATGARTRFVTPTWRPDGRAIVAASAAGDDTFNLVELPLDGSAARPLTSLTGGATWPDISPDGRTIVFVGYTIDGDDIFSMPYPADAAVTAVDASPPNTTGAAAAADADASNLPAADYSPLATLAPTSWTPVFTSGGGTTRLGADVSGSDLLGYHVYDANATWLLAAPSGALEPGAVTPDWQISYLYDRWRPTFFAAAGSATSFFAGAATAQNTPAQTTRRATEVEAGVLLPFVHLRVQHAAQISIGRERDEDTTVASTAVQDRTPLRMSWQTNTSRTYGYSISPEDGVTVGATIEAVRRALGSFADATTATVDLRAYLPSFVPHQLFAVRVAAGTSSGDPAAGRTFLLGGGDYPSPGVVSFDSRAVSLLRGFPDDTFAGSHVAVANAEYRFPIARPQRGVGTWPLMLHTIHAALFTDLGQAWTTTYRSNALKTSAGAELSMNVIAGYSTPYTFTTGAAWGHDGSGTIPDRVTVYFRVGKAF